MRINFAYTNPQQAKRTQHFYNTIEVLKRGELQARKDLGDAAPGSFHDIKRDHHRGEQWSRVKAEALTT
jgi:hypothetical protein